MTTVASAVPFEPDDLSLGDLDRHVLDDRSAPVHPGSSTGEA